MAIVRLSTPNSHPIADSDYTYQNDLISHIITSIDRPYFVLNGVIQAGSIFNIGGCIYYVNADYTIPGTIYNYIKIIPSSDGMSAEAVYSNSLTNVYWSNIYNGYFDLDGNLFLIDEKRCYIDGLITEIHLLAYDECYKRLIKRNEIFLTSGNFTVPNNVNKIWVTGCGRGGMGGNAMAPGGTPTGYCAGGGGGSSEFIFYRQVPVIPGEVIAISLPQYNTPVLIGAYLSIQSGQNGVSASNNNNAAQGGAGGAGFPSGYPSILVDGSNNLFYGGNGGGPYGGHYNLTYPGTGGGGGPGSGGGGATSIYTYNGAFASGGGGGAPIITIEW